MFLMRTHDIYTAFELVLFEKYFHLALMSKHFSIFFESKNGTQKTEIKAKPERKLQSDWNALTSDILLG